MQITIKGQTKEIKFNYKALFKANKDFSTVDAEGNNLGDGATNLFARVVMEDVEVITDIVKITCGIDKINDDVFDAIEELTDGGNEDKISEVLAELKDELKQSGFFVKSIKNQKKNLDDALKALEAKEQTEELQMQVDAIKRIQTLLNDNL